MVRLIYSSEAFLKVGLLRPLEMLPSVLIPVLFLTSQESTYKATDLQTELVSCFHLHIETPGTGTAILCRTAGYSISLGGVPHTLLQSSHNANKPVSLPISSSDSADSTPSEHFRLDSLNKVD